VECLPVGSERRDFEGVRRPNTSARIRLNRGGRCPLGAETDSVCACLLGSNSIDARLPPGRVCCAVELSKAVSPPAVRDQGESDRDDRRERVEEQESRRAETGPAGIVLWPWA
jgi:hypothetical protein